MLVGARVFLCLCWWIPLRMTLDASVARHVWSMHPPRKELKMSTEAREAFINIGTSRQGSTPPPRTPAHVLEELKFLGLIGKNNGLTRKGSIKHDLLWDELTTF